MFIIPAFSIRFRDQYGNLTDTPIGTVNFTELTGASSGTLTLTRSSLGVSSATVKRFYEAGDYILWVEGMTTTTGSRSFTVGSATDNRVTFTGVPTTVPAGAVVPSFTLHFTDAFGNLTDNGIGRLTYRRGTGTSSTATLAITRVQEGIYTAESTTCTLAGTYTLAMSSVSAANTFGTKSFVISSLAAVSATFSGVSISLNAGAQQAAFDIRYRDVYGNFTDTGIANAVQFSNATTANVGASTGTIAVYRRLGIGLYEFTRATFTTAGNYTLQVGGLLNTGHRVFRLVPSTTVRFVDFMTLPPNVYMGAEQAVSIFYRDPYNNSIESNRTISFTKSGTPSSTGTLSLTDGTLLGETIATFSKITVPGTYSLTVSGMTPVNLRVRPGNVGLPTIQIFEEEPNLTSVCFSEVQPQVVAGRPLQPFLARYLRSDAIPAMTYPQQIRYENIQNPAINGVLAMYRVENGVSRSVTSAVLTVAGTYRLFAVDVGITALCDETFEVIGGIASQMTVVQSTSNACITAGQFLSNASIEIRDQWGNRTNLYNNELLENDAFSTTFTATPNTSTGTLVFVRSANGILSATTSTIFTTAGTYSLELSIYDGENRITSTTLTFCVQPAEAVTAIFTNVREQVLERNNLPPFTVLYRDAYSNLTNNNVANRTVQAVTTASTTPIPMQTVGIGLGTSMPILFTVGTYTLSALTDNNMVIGTTTFTVRTRPAVRLIVVTQASIILVGTTATSIVVQALDDQGMPTNDLSTIRNNENYAITMASTNSSAILIPIQTGITGQFVLMVNGSLAFPGFYTVRVTFSDPITLQVTSSATLTTITVQNIIGPIFSTQLIQPSTTNTTTLAGERPLVLFRILDQGGNPTNDIQGARVYYTFQSSGAGNAFQGQADIENAGEVGVFRLVNPLQFNRAGVWNLDVRTLANPEPVQRLDLFSVSVQPNQATRATMTLVPSIPLNHYQNTMSLQGFDVANNVTPYMFSTTAIASVLNLDFTARSSSGTVVATGTIPFTRQGNQFVAAPMQFLTSGTYTFTFTNPVTGLAIPLANNSFEVQEETKPLLLFANPVVPRMNLGEIFTGGIIETTCTIRYQDITSDRRVIVVLKSQPHQVRVDNFDIRVDAADPVNAGITVQSLLFPLPNETGQANKQLHLTVPNTTGAINIIIKASPVTVGAVLTKVSYVIPKIARNTALPVMFRQEEKNGEYEGLAVGPILQQKIFAVGRDCMPSLALGATEQSSPLTLNGKTAGTSTHDDKTSSNTKRQVFNSIVYIMGGAEKQNGVAMRIRSEHPLQNILKECGLSANDVRPTYPTFNERDTLQTMSGNKRVKQANLSNIFTISAPNEATRKQLLQKLRTLPFVLFAHKEAETTTLDTRPNDPYIRFNPANLSNSTERTNNGVIFWGWYLEKINAYQAWDIYQGNPNVRIGIIDEAVPSQLLASYSPHPDLVNRLQNATAGLHPALHAQAVSGVIGAQANNCIGGAGLDWNARMFFYQTNENNIRQAADDQNDLHVLNMSFKSDNGYTESQRISCALAYKKNRLVVASNGNNSEENEISFPAMFGQGVIAVGGTNQDDNRIYSYGNHLDISAPAENIFVPVMPQQKFLRNDIFEIADPVILDNNYTYIQGTSFAAPQVSATLALIKGKALDKGLSLDNDDFENLLYLAADKVGGYSYVPRRLGIGNEQNTRSYGWNVPLGSRDEEGWEENIGYGRLNMLTALQYVNSGTFQQGTLSSATTLYPAPKQQLQRVIVNGAFGITDGKYDIEQYEITQTLTFPAGFDGAFVWGRGAGREADGMAPPEYMPGDANAGSFGLFGIGGSEIIPSSRTNTQTTFRTYIYRATKRYNQDGTETVVNIPFPTSPENVKFHYTLFKKPTTLLAFSKNSGNVQSAEYPTTTPLQEKQASEHSTRLTVFPNPTNGQATVRFTLAEDAHVSLSVIDILGNTILQPLLVQRSKQGEYALLISSDGLPLGVYRIRLTLDTERTREVRHTTLHIIR